MKHLTFALAAVILPLFCQAYKAVPLTTKQCIIAHQARESSTPTPEYVYLKIPPGTIRVVYTISIDDKHWPKPVGLHRQVEDMLSGSAPDYLIPYMVRSNKNDRARVSFQLFDQYNCVREFYAGSWDQCISSAAYRQSKGGTFDIPWLPSTEGQYFICFQNDGNTPECYVRVEAIAIVK
jgi:hypothetical protein